MSSAIPGMSTMRRSLHSSRPLDPVSGMVTDAYGAAARQMSLRQLTQLPGIPDRIPTGDYIVNIKTLPVTIIDEKLSKPAAASGKEPNGEMKYTEFINCITSQGNLEAAMCSVNSSLQGLTEEERKVREGIHGLNIAVDPMEVDPLWKLWLGQWTDFIVLLLLAAGIAMAFLGEIPACIMISAILAANATIGATMEHNGLKQLAALINSEKTEVTVVVGGAETTIDSRYLFPGDVVLFAQGASVPADCFILSLKSEESTRSDANLNGESDGIHLSPVIDKESESQFPCNALPAGCIILTGKVLAMVFQTGKKTMAGQIQQGMAETKEEEPETTKKVDDLIKKVGYVSVLAGVIVFVIGSLLPPPVDVSTSVNITSTTDPAANTEPPWLQLLMVSVSLIAAAVPEGLPVVKVIVMARAMLQMAANNAQMRSTKATESSAGITVLCSDKTGTLTEGTMSFVRLVVGTTGRILHVSGSKPDNFKIECDGKPFDPKGNHGSEGEAILDAFSVLMNQCSVTSSYNIATNEWTSAGGSNFIDIATSRFNFSETGARLSAKFGPEDVVVDHPFDSAVKFAASVFRDNIAKCFRVIVKGASDKPEFEQYMNDGDKKARDVASDEGLRLLALFTRKVSFEELKGETEAEFFSKTKIIDKLNFCGFAVFQDPPRADAREAITVCRDQAGVKVKMITGDNPRTALSIAKQIGIAAPETTVENGVLHMQNPMILAVFTEFAELERLQQDAEKDKKVVFTETQREVLAAHEKAIGHWITTRNVIARALPLHKRSIVHVLQNLGEIVAMTGDGVNDAAALKAAHLGVAMDNGADVTKEAADMVLRDNKFSTIVNVAIRGGRVIGANLRKFIYLLGSTNIAEVLIFIAAPFLKIPVPAGPILILYINLVTDSVVALALGLEPPEHSVMMEGPADPMAPLIPFSMWIRIGLHTIYSTVLFLVYYICMLSHYTGNWRGTGGSEAGVTSAQTALVQLIVASEMLRGFCCKNFDTNDWRLNNPMLNFSVLTGIGFTILIAVIPTVNEFFGLNSMDAVGWVSSLGLALTVFPVDMILKKIVPRTVAFHKHAVVLARNVPNAAKYGIVIPAGETSDGDDTTMQGKSKAKNKVHPVP